MAQDPEIYASATADLESWWAEKRPKIGGGHTIQRVLDEQVNRIALDEAHRLSAKYSLSDADRKTLVFHAIEHCEAPRVK